MYGKYDFSCEFIRVKYKYQVVRRAGAAMQPCLIVAVKTHILVDTQRTTVYHQRQLFNMIARRE
jgi:hypothetical protein